MTYLIAIFFTLAAVGLMAVALHLSRYKRRTPSGCGGENEACCSSRGIENPGRGEVSCCGGRHHST
jgi:hypothetical protein